MTPNRPDPKAVLDALIEAEREQDGLSDEEYERLKAQHAVTEKLLPMNVFVAYLSAHPRERERYQQEARERSDGWQDALQMIEWRAMDWWNRLIRSAGETPH